MKSEECPFANAKEGRLMVAIIVVLLGHLSECYSIGDFESGVCYGIHRSCCS